MTPHDVFRKIWDDVADHWDQQVGEGNDFQKLLIWPSIERMLQPAVGLVVLDACCGNGNFARRLSRLGCEVTAFDGSSRMIELATARTHKGDGTIEFKVADACDEAAVLSVAPEKTFDAIVCNMAVFDLPVLLPLLMASARLLKPGGSLIVSSGHPSFFTNESVKWATQDDGQGEAVQTFGCLVTRYLADWAHESRGILGQPRPHMLWHRSLSTLLREFFLAGFVMNACEEPAFPVDTRLRSPFSWARRHDIPPVIVMKFQSQPE